MMSERSRADVPRGDHASHPERDDADRRDESTVEHAQVARDPDAGDEIVPENRGEGRADPGVDSAPHRGHGAHGRGAHEEHFDADTPKPPFADGTDRGGDAGWDGSRAGGSTFDKR
jgi:hypothetical protein